MKKQQIIIGIFIILFLIFLVIGIYLSYFGKQTKETEKNQNIVYKYENERNVENCKLPEACLSDEYYYAKLIVDTKNKTLQKFIEQINKETEEYYQKMIKSTTNSSECSDKIREKYQYRYATESIYHNYENRQYAQFGISRKEKDYCKKQVKHLQLKVYFYDKKNKKALSSEQLMKQLKITQKDIDKKLKEENYNNHYDKFQLYFSIRGEQYLHFHDIDKDEYQIIPFQFMKDSE